MLAIPIDQHDPHQTQKSLHQRPVQPRIQQSQQRLEMPVTPIGLLRCSLMRGLLFRRNRGDASDPRHISARARINPDHISNFDKGRNLGFKAGFGHHTLGYGGGPVALNRSLGLHHFQIYGRR